MALPTITSNSPAAGFIKWTAFSLSFDGVSYAVPAGQTDKRFTVWKYNGGAPTLAYSDVLPTDLVPADLLLFLNKAGIGLLAPMTEVVDGSIIVSGSILADAIGANQIDSYHVKANAVTATQLAATSVYAEHVASGAITANKLSIGAVSDNMVVNGSFEDGVQGWERITGSAPVDIVSGVAASGAYCLRVIANGAACYIRQTKDFWIPVSAEAGRKWAVTARIGAGTDNTLGVHIQAEWYGDDKNAGRLGFTTIARGTIGTSWQEWSGQVEPPSGAKYMCLRLILPSGDPTAGTAIYLDSVTAQEVVIAAQIGDGQIIAPKIAAGAITASKLSVGAVSDNLVVNGGFEDGVEGWQLFGTTTASQVTLAGATGAYCLRITANGTDNTVTQSDNFLIPVAGNAQKIVVGARIRASAAATSGVTLRASWYNSTKALISTVDVATATLSTAWVDWADQITPPSMAAWMRTEIFVPSSVAAGRYAYVDEITVLEVVVSAQIADGAITTPKIIANAVATAQIAAGAVTATEIAAGAVTAAKLETALALVSELIAGPTTGAHARLNQTGFHAFRKALGMPTPVEVVSLGVDGSGEYLTIGDAEGNTLTVMDDVGFVGARQLEATYDVAAQDFVLSGESPTMWVPRFAPRIVASVEISSADYAATWSGNRFKNNVGWKRAAYLTWTNEDTIPHRVWLPGVDIPIRRSTSNVAGAGWMYAIGATASEPSFSHDAHGYWPTSLAGEYASPAASDRYATVPAGQTIRAALDVYNGGFEWVFTSIISLSMWDMGPADLGEAGDSEIRPLTLTTDVNTGSGTTTKTTTKTVDASWYKPFFRDSGAASTYYGSKAVQGSYSGAAAQALKGMIGFPALNIPAAAVVSKVEMLLTAEHTYNNSGATFGIGVHNALTAPASLSGGSALTTKALKAGQSAWVTLPLDQAGRNLFRGSSPSYRGFLLYAASNAVAFYGYTGAGVKARVTYTTKA